MKETLRLLKWTLGSATTLAIYYFLVWKKTFPIPPQAKDYPTTIAATVNDMVMSFGLAIPLVVCSVLFITSFVCFILHLWRSFWEVRT